MFVKVIDHNVRVRFFGTQCSKYVSNFIPNPHLFHD